MNSKEQQLDINSSGNCAASTLNHILLYGPNWPKCSMIWKIDSDLEDKIDFTNNKTKSDILILDIRKFLGHEKNRLILADTKMTILFFMSF